VKGAPHARHAGLTLVELLLALGIGALLMAPLALMFQDGLDANAGSHAQLDLNGELRFALDRIAVRAAGSTPWAIALAPSYAPNGMLTVPPLASWLQAAPTAGKGTVSTTTTYALSGNPQVGADLVETQTDSPGGATRTSVIASNVTAFRLTAPDAAYGQPLVKAELTLSKGGASASGVRTFRLWGAQ
jgi:Tfp pilus assembly protein FimT